VEITATTEVVEVAIIEEEVQTEVVEIMAGGMDIINIQNRAAATGRDSQITKKEKGIQKKLVNIITQTKGKPSIERPTKKGTRKTIAMKKPTGKTRGRMVNLKLRSKKQTSKKVKFMTSNTSIMKTHTQPTARILQIRLRMEELMVREKLRKRNAQECKILQTMAQKIWILREIEREGIIKARNGFEKNKIKS
jgi:hypothetical protein